MFDGLRHDAIISSDDEQREIDAGGTRYHLAHETLVAGYVHDAHCSPVWEFELRKAELDGDATLLFFGQTIGVGAGKRQHECRFAVVDMARGSQYEVVHDYPFSLSAPIIQVLHHQGDKNKKRNATFGRCSRNSLRRPRPLNAAHLRWSACAHRRESIRG